MKQQLPQEVHFTNDACVIVMDVNSYLQPDYATLLAQYPISDGLRDISICMSSAPTDVEGLMRSIADSTFSYASVAWLVFFPGFVLAGNKKNMSPVDYADWLYEQCDQINRKACYRAAWIEAYGEIGNSVTWPQGIYFSKKEALLYFRDWFRGGRSLTEHWGKLTDPETPTFYSHAKSRDTNLRNLPIYYSEGTLFAIHEAFRQGFPYVCYEGGCGTRNVYQAGISFVRGGAKMFDAFWGVDLSPWTWGPCGWGPTQTNNQGGWRTGGTPDSFFRIWITAYLSGANSILHEVGYCFFYTHNEKRIFLSDYGYEAMRFYRLTREALSDRGVPVVPFAVMLEEEHGYRGDQTREFNTEEVLSAQTYRHTPGQRLQIWSNRVEDATKGDWQVERMISGLWPAPENRWRDFAGSPPDTSLATPDSDTPELKAKLDAGVEDPREYSFNLADSRWADCFDVITEDISVNAMERHYRAIILCGDIETDNGLFGRLKEFISQGGKVITCVEHLDIEARNTLGIESIPGPRPIHIESLRIADTDYAIREDSRVYSLPAMPHMCSWAIDLETGTPLVLQWRHGKGELFIVLCAGGMDYQMTKTSEVMNILVDRLYETFVGVKKDHPGVQMLVNRRKKDTLVALQNHTGNPWRGTIEFTRKGYPPVEEVREVIRDKVYPGSHVRSENDSINVDVSVPAFQTAILSFGPKGEDEPYNGWLTTTSGRSEEDEAYLKHLRDHVQPIDLLERSTR